MLTQLQRPRAKSGYTSTNPLQPDVGGNADTVSSSEDSVLPAPPSAFPLDRLEDIRAEASSGTRHGLIGIREGDHDGGSGSPAGDPLYEAITQERTLLTPSAGNQPRSSIDSFSLPPDYTEYNSGHQKDPSDDSSSALPAYPSVQDLSVPLTYADTAEQVVDGHGWGGASPAEKDPRSVWAESPRSIRRSHQPSRLSLSSLAGDGGNSTLQDEKRKMDLDAVTSAIDRMYDVAPPMDNQRYVPRAGPSRTPTSAVHQEHGSTFAESNEKKQSPTQAIFNFAMNGLGRDRSSGKRKDLNGDGVKGKGKESQVLSAENEQELRKLWDQIEKAHGHRLDHQSFDPNSDAQAAKTSRKREFFSELLDSSSAGRLQNQDAASPAASSRTAFDMMTMKEFVADPRARQIVTGGIMPGVNGVGELEAQDPLNRQRSSSLPVNKYTGRTAGSLPPTPTSAHTLYNHEEASESMEELRKLTARGSGTPGPRQEQYHTNPMARQTSRSSTGSRRSTVSSGIHPIAEQGKTSGGGGILKRLGLSRRGSTSSVLSLAGLGGTKTGERLSAGGGAAVGDAFENEEQERLMGGDKRMAGVA